METAATRENYREVLSWLRGGDITPDPVMEERFLSVMANLVQEKMRSQEQKRIEEEARRRQEARNRPSPLSLRSIIGEMNRCGEIDCTYEELFGKTPASTKTTVDGTRQEQPEEKVEAADEYDSVVIGKVFRYIGVLEQHRLNMSQIQILTYITYGTYLASTGRRLTGEHPQMWQFGPVFPRAYNKIRKDTSDGAAEYESILKVNPKLIDFMTMQFHRFGFMTATEAGAQHMADGSPWAKARKDNPDKWGVQMDDETIREWFASRMKTPSGRR